MRYTDAPRRRDELLRHLRATGYVSATRVAAELDVSEMTIRRDLRILSDDGLAVRVTGGARLPDGAGVPFDVRTDRSGSEKTAVARAASELLEPGATVALDSGTTLARLAGVLPSDLTVVTHSVPVISACSDRDDLRLIGLGGIYQPATRSFSGSAVHDALADIALDVAVLSATAVGSGGVFCTDPYDADTKRALASAARTVIVAADSSKLAARAPIRFGSADTVTTLVTDDAAPVDVLDELRATGMSIVLAPTTIPADDADAEFTGVAEAGRDLP